MSASDKPIVLGSVRVNLDDAPEAVCRKLNDCLTALTFRMIRRGGPEFVSDGKAHDGFVVWNLMSHRVGAT